MEAILSTLGLNVTGFIVHSINFLVLLGLLYLILFKPVTRLLDERTERIRSSLERAEEVKAQTEQAEVERQALLAEIRRESETMRQRADEQAKRIMADAEAAAQERASQILARAQAEIESSRLQMMAEVRSHVADLVVSATERVTKQALDGQSQRVLIQQFLATETAANGAAPTRARA